MVATGFNQGKRGVGTDTNVFPKSTANPNEARSLSPFGLQSLAEDEQGER